MSRSMTTDELVTLFEYVRNNHNVPNSDVSSKVVKYLDPHFDNRTGDIFSIQIRGYGWKYSLYTSNEEVDNPKSLFDRCIEFLNTPFDAPIPRFIVGEVVRLEGGEMMTIKEVNNPTNQVLCQWFEGRTINEQWFDYCDVIKVDDEELEKLKNKEVNYENKC